MSVKGYEIVARNVMKEIEEMGIFE